MSTAKSREQATRDAAYWAYVRRVVAEAPKPTQAQIDRIRVLMGATEDEETPR
jgi:hypothetical protein